ncbi:MAG TPA: sodium:solute symporter [Saprospiraceae bacterium]|nr:sodium:solute symporter [Saprospiraceae bacterium]HRO08472.1 sodium:solute symporter [Saprospiraceae bacterium]HRP41857.1 sodium:solute symporter [Saprospiraceae bacterium]
MSLSQATLLVLILYAIVTLVIVYRGAVKTKNIEDFTLGSGFSPVVVGLSLAASITSAATFIINPGFVALYGWSAFLAMSVVLPLALFLSLVVLSKSFRKYGTSQSALTMAQWIGNRYNSRTFSYFIVAVSLLLITFIVLICVGITKVLGNALGVSELLILVILVVFVFGYTMFGGANSMVYTNTIQALLMIIVAVILLASGSNYLTDGIDAFWGKLATLDPKLVTSFNDSSPLFRDWFEVIFANFIVGIAIVCQPHIITKSLMLKSDKDVNKFLIVTILVETLFFAVLFAGFYARLMFPDLTINGDPIKMDGILSAYVVRRFATGVGVIVVLGLLAAGLSTLEGLVQSLSATITNDLIVPLKGWKGQTQKINNTNKIVIGLLAIITILVSYQQLLYPNLSVGILAQNGVYAYFSMAFVPVLFGIFFKNTPKQAAFGAAITALIVHFTVYYGSLTPYTTGSVKNPAVAAALAIIAAVLTGTILYQIYKKKQKYLN